MIPKQFSNFHRYYMQITGHGCPMLRDSGSMKEVNSDVWVSR